MRGEVRGETRGEVRYGVGHNHLEGGVASRPRELQRVGVALLDRLAHHELELVDLHDEIIRLRGAEAREGGGWKGEG